MRFVVNNPDPFIVRIGHASANGSLSYPIEKPLTTITSKAEHCLLSPTLIQTGYGERKGQAPRVPGLEKPLGTVVAGGKKHAVVAAFLAKHYTGATGTKMGKPIDTVTAIDHHSLVLAHLVRPFGQSVGQSPDEPAPTVMPGGAGKIAVATSHIVKMKGDNIGQDQREPLHTITAGGTHFGEVRAFLIKYYGTDQAPKLDEPLHTVTTKDRFGLVTIQCVNYMIVDIGMRMLQPRELFRAQSFPDSYIIDLNYKGKPMTQGAKVRMCGNSVPPEPAEALVVANYNPAEAMPRRHKFCRHEQRRVRQLILTKSR
jgi:DNA (cytosine-5)-methyltransferase 1